MYINSLKFLLLLNSKSIFEEVSQTYFSVMGNDFAVDVLSERGYSMQEDQYLFGDSGAGAFSFNISNSLTVGFWIYSVNHGEVENPTTNSLEALELTVLDFRGTSNVSVDSQSAIKITEVSNDSNQNQIKLDFDNGAYTALSEKYDSNKWHHIWCTYNGIEIALYLDGKLTTLNVTGTVPSSIEGTFMDVYINHSFEGYAYNLAKHTGFIDEIFMLNDGNNNEVDIQRVINYGISYVVDDLYINVNTDGYGVYFNDPTTITINTSIDDMSYIYLGRNDGKILRGSPLFWEVRKIYSNDSESGLLSLEEDNKVEDGLLKIKTNTIRL